jgi:hypothetical protein
VFNDDDRTGAAPPGDRAESGWRRFVPRPLGATRG